MVLLADPTPLTRELRLVPTDGNPTNPKFFKSPRGFRVFGLRQGTFFDRVGLQNGDVLVAVNRAWLGSPAEAMLAVAGLGSGNEVTLSVARRDAKELTVLRLKLLDR